MSRARIAIAVCALALAACSNPDNLVVGGILGTGTAPDATITVVASAISGDAMVIGNDGAEKAREVVILSDQTNLCDTLATNPDFFTDPTSPIVALIMAAPQEMVGTFYPGSLATSALLLASAGPGQGIYGYAGVSGTESVSSFDTREKGVAEGQFDIEFIDTQDNQYEIYGQFKTTQCDALGAAFIPQLLLGGQ